MTTITRGRGWSSLQDVPNRRPGDVLRQEQESVDSLLTEVQKLNLNDCEKYSSFMNSFELSLKSACVTKNDLRTFVKRLHDRSLEDRQFGLKAAAIIGNFSFFSAEDLKLRFAVLDEMQKDFEERSQLQTSSLPKFLNSVSLFGELFHSLRLLNGCVVRNLSTPALQYLDMLLAGEEHELELFTTQLAINGRKLYDICRPELDDLLLRVRTTLMSRNLSGQSKCWLLLALDLAAQRFTTLPKELQTFYQMHLGTSALTQLQRKGSDLTVDVTNPIKEKDKENIPEEKPVVKEDEKESKDSVPTVNDLKTQALAEAKEFKFRPMSLMKSLESNSKNAEETKKENGMLLKCVSPPPKSNEEPTWSKRTDYPKTKGSNTGKYQDKGDVSKFHEKDEVWKVNEKNSSGRGGYYHDDRFEKDENFYGKQEPRNNNRNNSKDGREERRRDKKSPSTTVGGGEGEERWD